MSSTTPPLNLSGVVVTDVRGLHWRIGAHLGSGGFGSIYLACEATSGSLERGLGVPEDTQMAIKVEPHDNGSLFTEMHFYHRCAKLDKMEEWQRQRGLDYVGMPRLHGSGSFVFRRQRYRFIVIDRFGTDLQTILSVNEGRMPLKTALTVAIRVTDILEYVHFHGYVHKDVKAQNLLLGFDDPNKIYLVDFGLACRYFVYESGYEVHKELKEDLRRAHDGTIEFTSRDGHLGAHSRRSDLEVLLYNLIYWVSGKLPWSSNREDAEEIASQKEIYMRDPQELMVVCFGRKGAPPYILEFANYVARLDFHEKPNYELCREMFKQAILKSGFRHDMQLQFEGGIVRIQSKRKCRKSFRLEKEKRLRVEQESQASLSGSSSGSVAATRLRRRTTHAVAGAHTEAGATTTDDDDNDSSLSDRPSSVKRSCFDSRQSSGRRTGRQNNRTSEDQEVPQGPTVVTIDRQTKEARRINLFELREAQRAYEREREHLMNAARENLRQLDEAAKVRAEADSVCASRVAVKGAPLRGNVTGEVRMVTRPDKDNKRRGVHQRERASSRSRAISKTCRGIQKIGKQTRFGQGPTPATRVTLAAGKQQVVAQMASPPAVRQTRRKTLREQAYGQDKVTHPGIDAVAGRDKTGDGQGRLADVKKKVTLVNGGGKSEQKRTNGVAAKSDKESHNGFESSTRVTTRKTTSRYVRSKNPREIEPVEGMSLRNRRLPLAEVSNSK